MKSQFLALCLSALTMATLAGCGGGGGGSSGGGATAASAITITPYPATVVPDGQIMLTPGGGVAPYTFTLQTVTGSTATGQLSTPSGYFVTMTAGSSTGTLNLVVTDANNSTNNFTITVAGTPLALTLMPLTTNVVVNGAVPFTATGGVSPYTYSILTPATGGGTFTGSTYYAPATAMTVTVQVRDFAGSTVQATVTVTSSSTTTGATCEGNYNATIYGVAGSLEIIEDSIGNISGYISVNGGADAIWGTCVSGVINFQNLNTGSQYSGTYFTNSSNPSQVAMSGNFIDNQAPYAGTYPWSALSF